MLVNVVGKFLFFFGATALGIAMAMELQKRCSVLREMLKSLEVLDRELGFALLPVEGLLLKAASGAKEEVKSFFEECMIRFSKREEESLEQSLEDIWVESLKEELPSLQDEDKVIIEEIGAVLGRYDGESQQKAFKQIYDRLQENVVKAKQELDQKGKVYIVLGVVTGLFFAIVF